jgi:hypothetical protein
MPSRFLTRIALMAAGCFAGNAAFAQACATIDGTFLTTGLQSGNSCGKNLGLTTICGGTDPTNGAGTSIYQFSIGPAATSPLNLTIVSTTTGFNPELALIGSPCSSLAGCLIDDTNNTQTVGPDFFPVVPGSYFVFVTDLNPELPGCGDFGLSINGEFPVRLQDFSVD